MNQVLFLTLILGFISQVAGECANACNGHGTCTSYDMCICYRNWQANDCSERTCQFGLAHVDTPKGDLDNDGFVKDVSATDPASPVVIENNFVYPYGTTEMFPRMMDSDRKVITNSAHYYMECSNKGTCDRKKGTCKCFAGYDGAACQRASCPGYPDSCSGHGVCKSIQQLAKADNDNIYELWDRHTTMGCECDAGYYGADCSSRKCKNGIDPLYYDDSTTIKYSEFNFATLTWDTTGSTPYFTDGMANSDVGKWAIRFYDHTGEDWLTEPITAGATCKEVQDALENLPNEVIPVGSTFCSLVDDANSTASGNWVDGKDMYAFDGTPSTGNRIESDPDKIRLYTYNMSFWETANVLHDATTDPTNDASTSGLPYSYLTRETDGGQIPQVKGFIYKIKFYGNPGKLQEPEIETYLDGDRPSLAAKEYKIGTTDTPKTAQVLTKVWTDGMQGEDKDYFADHCDGVRVIPKIFKNIAGGASDLVDRDIHYLHFVDVDSSGGWMDEMNKLKVCLGGSDDKFYNNAAGNENNVETYDWDYGTVEFPHIIKLVRTITTINDGGHYAILLYRSENATSIYSFDNTTVPIHYSESLGANAQTGFFEILNPWVPGDATGRRDQTNEYDVYTTKGTLALVAPKANAYFGFGTKEIYMYNYGDHANRLNFTVNENKVDAHRFYEGSVSCEVKNSDKYRSSVSHGTWDRTNWEANYITYCVDKSDLIIPLAIGNDAVTAEQIYVNYNAPDVNIYTATKLWTKTPQNWDRTVWNEGEAFRNLRASMFKHTIKTDLSLNWGTQTDAAHFRLYKFFPHVDSTYTYVAECSNRGLCDADGICECFPGYGNDNCNEQNSLAV
jgi:hypothetical protein